MNKDYLVTATKLKLILSFTTKAEYEWIKVDALKENTWNPPEFLALNRASSWRWSMM